MKLVSMVLAAALVPAAAFANPNNPSSQGQQTNSASNGANQNMNPDVTVESFEMSTGQGRLGVMVEGMTPQLRSYFGATSGNGLLVAGVEPNSAAASAGVKVGDVITKVGSQNVQSTDDIISAVNNAQGSSTPVKIHVIRNHRGMDLKASLTKRSTQSSTSP